MMITSLRALINTETYADEQAVLARLVAEAGLSDQDRTRIVQRAVGLVREIRGSSDPGMMELFLAEYGLSTDEGVALMCLAEALLRVPDAATIDALIEDKIAPSDWGKHLGQSASSLVNASTWALMLTGRVLDDEGRGLGGVLRGAIKRVGEPVIRSAVSKAMREMGRQFVLGETIEGAQDRAAEAEAQGYTYSYDMLGEAARTAKDAQTYFDAYAEAITSVAKRATHPDPRLNPGISVKLSALHPRYEFGQSDRVMTELVPRVSELARLAAKANIGFNIDAEEADRLAISLDVVEKVAADPDLAAWDGFGLVVQAYGLRASYVIDWFHQLAERLDRRFMLRLVKGAYWDTEIKLAQVEGLRSFPVFTFKAATDVSYIANARRLLGMTDRIYPQFATHNAHTTAAVLEMAGNSEEFEFQRLHGMGEQLHDILLKHDQTRCRIYAPVGAHKDLLAYLVRRLLENGANSSFVNKIVDEDVPPEDVAADPFEALEAIRPKLLRGSDLFLPERRNSVGFDLSDALDLARIEDARVPFKDAVFEARPILADDTNPLAPADRHSPNNTFIVVGHVQDASDADIQTALGAAATWEADAKTRAEVLNSVADLYEAEFGQFFALLAREAGKTLNDAVGELREAVDFLRYYAHQAQNLATPPVGVFTCISPWNFPLAIFTGQIAGALAAGNGVLAKPAETTPLVAYRAVQLMHKAGVPATALQLLPGTGSRVGAALISDPRVGGVAFTGSTATALRIRHAMADNLVPDAPLIAETGGLNAMIVDSTALPEQAVRDVIESAFQSAGQRCSALRCLYVQEDIAEPFLKMLFGAMEELRIDDPWLVSTDIGPLIDEPAWRGIVDHIDAARADGRLLYQTRAPRRGHFLPPTVLRVSGIGDMQREVFGPVLHVATFRADDFEQVLDDINGTGYGLTFGLHSRIDDRVQLVSDRLKVGNIYVNRNQIGAIVGSQPFGGQGLSGTGPKAGGPMYLSRFVRGENPNLSRAYTVTTDDGPIGGDGASSEGRELRFDILPGPTGESNRLTTFARGPILCLGPGLAAHQQKTAVEALGGIALVASDLEPDALGEMTDISAVLWWGDAVRARIYAQTLARRNGPIVQLISAVPRSVDVTLERHLCIDTTASGGNAELLAAQS